MKSYQNGLTNTSSALGRQDTNSSYQHLKKVVYSLERAQYSGSAQEVPELLGGDHFENESEHLLNDSPSDTDKVFVVQLDKELRKIVDFYCAKEKELVDNLDVVRDHIRMAEDEYEGNVSGADSDADLSEDLDESTAHDRRHKVASHTRRHWRSRASSDTENPTPSESSETLPLYRRWFKTFGRRGSFRRTHHRRSSAQEGSDFEFFHGGNASLYESHSDHAAPRSVWTSPDEFAIDIRLTLKREINELYNYFYELQQYAELNITGMKKILKKYDKIIASHLKERYLERVVKAKYPFQIEAKHRLEEYQEEVVHMYAHVATRNDTQQAEQQLQSQLREEVVWQRNTVWREMINIERRAQAASLEKSLIGTAAGDLLTDEVRPARVLHTRFGDIMIPSFITAGTVQLFLSVALFIMLLKNPFLRIFEKVEMQNCFAMLVFCTCLWVTEVIPLFVTSLLVPFLIVTLRVVRVEGKKGETERLGAPETSKWIFQQMFAPNVSLLLGGFTLAAALSKYGIDKVLATRVLRFAGSRPSTVLLAHMLVSCFASMWISNVAAPVLMFSLVQPILRNLPPQSPFATSLVMGIALASNIGGQTSPIASPQNLIALEYMEEPIGWLQWFAITIPVSGLSLLALWALLLWNFGTGNNILIKRIPEPNEPFQRTQWFISAVCLGTIVLWCLERSIEWIVGDMAVIAILPLVLFFGTGILTKEDFNNFLWTIVFLAMGGIALGKGVDASGLLANLNALIQRNVDGLPFWGILFLLVSIGLTVATFISHTIAAVLLVPIAAEMGASLADPHPRLLIMVTVLTASAAMGLPISGFPNMTAINLEDEVGQRYVSVKTFLRVGVPASIIATTIIATVGYSIMKLLGL